MHQTFIIIDPDAIVVLDLRSMLEAEYPSARILCHDTLKSASGDVQIAGPETAILVKGALLDDDTADRQLVANAAARKCRVLKIGPFSDTSIPAEWIDIPFRTENVISFLDHKTRVPTA